MDVVGREAINEVVLRWVAQKLCRRFGYRITYFCYFSYPFSKLRDLHAFGLARSVAKMRKFLITSGVRCPSQCGSPAETTAKKKTENKDGKKKHISSFDRRISDLAVLMV